VFGRKSRAERLREQVEGTGFVPVATMAAVYSGARPILERLLYDDNLRDNIRDFIEAARKITDELSDESPDKIVTRLWDDDKLRKQVEMAAGAVQQGNKRVRGQSVRGGGGGFKLVFWLISGAMAFLFLNPKTGPQARQIVSDAIGSVTSSD
jgi:hypothetical protein